MRQPITQDQQRYLLKPFRGESVTPPPVWLMRQAGRYLPEYRAVREQAGGFLDLCYAPSLAAEVTLQPVRRFGLDAAILFADILLVPDALGQGVRFVEGEGPWLDPIRDGGSLSRLDPNATGQKFSRVWETVARVRQDLPPGVALIGFCGAPWTVATYMVEGHGSTDQREARRWAYHDPVGFRELIDLLVAVSVEFLSGQIAAGADVVQIFDSWAGSLPSDEFESWIVDPTRRLVAGLKARHPETPVIGFPRGAGLNALTYAETTGVDGLGCDTMVPMRAMRERTDGLKLVLQGNLDPLLLMMGGSAMKNRVATIRDEMQGARFIFNLGHGVVPETPPGHVADLVAFIREG